MAKISVIIPVYNVEEYLERCLNSVVNQTFKDLEIICVNDGSTDSSGEILQKFARKDARIKIIKRPNGGLSAARNTGLEVMSGEYFAFLDSDDWIDLNFYEKLYEKAKEFDADIAMTDFIRKGKNKHKIRLNLNEEKLYTTIENKIKAANLFKEGCVWNKLYKRSRLGHLRFIEGVYFEDGPYSIRALYESYKLVTVTGTYLYYFQNKKSIVKTMTPKKREDKIKNRQNMMRFIKEKNINVPDKSFWAVKKMYNFCGINFLTVYESIKSKKYCLFNVLPVWRTND